MCDAAGDSGVARTWDRLRLQLSARVALFKIGERDGILDRPPHRLTVAGTESRGHDEFICVAQSDVLAQSAVP